MPNLRTWIEAQLKRGYSRKQIKAVLTKKGYPPKAVAEVDKIASSRSNAVAGMDKRLSNTNRIQMIVLVIGVALAIGTAAYFTISKEPSKGPASALFNTFCDKFKGADYKISCEEAIKAVLTARSEYLILGEGEIQGVYIENITIPTFLVARGNDIVTYDDPKQVEEELSRGDVEIRAAEKTVWAVMVGVDEPFINIETGKPVYQLKVNIGIDDNKILHVLDVVE